MRFHLRRKDKEIADPQTMAQVLGRAKYVTLAMVGRGEPYLVSLSHAYDEGEGCIYFHCAGEGKKLEILRANPVVWGQALLDYGYHVGECSHLYASVMFKGRVEFIEDSEEKREALGLMIEALDPEPEKIRDRLLSSQGLPGTVVGRVRIEYMTGKKSPEVEF